MEHQPSSLCVTLWRLVWRVLVWQKAETATPREKAIPFHSSGDHYPNVQAFGVKTEGLMGGRLQIHSVDNPERGSKSVFGERAKRARHSQVCTIENRGYYILG